MWNIAGFPRGLEMLESAWIPDISQGLASAWSWLQVLENSNSPSFLFSSTGGFVDQSIVNINHDVAILASYLRFALLKKARFHVMFQVTFQLLKTHFSSLDSHWKALYFVVVKMWLPYNQRRWQPWYWDRTIKDGGNPDIETVQSVLDNFFMCFMPNNTFNIDAVLLLSRTALEL